LDKSNKLYTIFIPPRDSEIKGLKEKLDSKMEEGVKLTAKLMDYKTKMSNIELQLRRFSVKKIYRFYANTEVEV
jgi:hypothetical protein